MRLLLLAASLYFCVTALAVPLTPTERDALSLRIDATITTMGQKFLPPNLVKNSLAKASGSNAGILKTTFKSWSRNFSSDVTYMNLGDGIFFFYKHVPVLSMRVVKMSPFTVSLNDKNVVLEGNDGLAALKSALKQEKFVAAEGKHFSLISEAYAQEASGPTIENSVILTGDFIHSAAEDAPEMVKEGFLLPDTRFGLFKYVARDKTLQCNGEAVEGKLTDKKNTYSFRATRSGGLEIVGQGVTFKAKMEKPTAFQKCDEAAQFPDSDRNKAFSDLGDDNATVKGIKSQFVDQYLEAKYEDALKECKDKNWLPVKAAMAAAGRPPQEDYYARRQYDDLEFNIERKCRFDFQAGQSREADLKKIAADANEQWPNNRTRLIERYFQDHLHSLANSCDSLNYLKPTIKINCAAPKTIGALKDQCAKLNAAAPKAPSEFQVCYVDKSCEPLKGVRFDDLAGFTEKRKILHQHILDFKQKYSKEFTSGAVKDNHGDINVADPNLLSGKRINEITDDIRKLYDDDFEISRASTAHNRDEPYIRDIISGTLGLLECCQDSHCKLRLAKLGVNLQPLGNNTPTGK